MASSKIYRSSRRILPLLATAALGLLAACGDHGTPPSPSLAKVQNPVAENPAKPCSYAGGHPAKADADLFAAAAEGDASRVRQIIGAGGNVNATDSLKRTPLFAAAFCNRPEMENLLIDKGAAVGAKDFLGMEPLHATVLVGASDGAKALIARGARLDARNAAGFTPLHLAAATRQMALVGVLLDSGAKVEAHDLDGIGAASFASPGAYQAFLAKNKKTSQPASAPN